MSTKEVNMSGRSDADLQAIQTSVAFKNISDAVEQYRRQFGLAFLALIAFSAIHVGLVVIANLYTMQTRVSNGTLIDASASHQAVGTAKSTEVYDIAYIMTNMNEQEQIKALGGLESASFVDKDNAYRQYTVTGFQLGGWKRSELKLYTSVGHVLEYVRGRGIRVVTEGSAAPACNCSSSRRSLLGKPRKPEMSEMSGMSTWDVSPTIAMPWQTAFGETSLVNTEKTAQENWDWITNKAGVTDNMVSWGQAIKAGYQTGSSYRPGTGADKDQLKTIDFYELSQSDGDAVMSVKTVDMSDNEAAQVVNDNSRSGWTGASPSQQAAALEAQVPLLTSLTSKLVAGADTIVTEMGNAAGDGKWIAKDGTWSRMVTNAFVDTYGKDKVSAVKGVLDFNSDASWAMNNDMTKGVINKGFAEFNKNFDTMMAPTEDWKTHTFFGMLYSLSEDDVTDVDAKTIDANWKSVVADQVQGYLNDGYDTDQAIAYEVSEVLGTVSASVGQMIKGYSQYKASGFIGALDSDIAVKDSTYAASNYGCTGESNAAQNSDLSWPSGSLGRHNTDINAQTWDKCQHAGGAHAVAAGYFFSGALGTYEAFLLHLPASYCQAVKSLGGKAAIKGMQNYDWYLYFLHGWGETANVVLEVHEYMGYLDQEGACGAGAACIVDSGILLIAPDDCASPYGCKHSYRNSEFVGHHMDMIVFELPAFIELNMGLLAYGKGLMGMSMGGMGTLSIMMTYASQFVAGAAFNGPTSPNQCMDSGVCHLECAVNPFMCELLWTSIHAAFNPYVLVKTGRNVASEGFYDPVANGIAAKLRGERGAYCGTGTPSWMSSVQMAERDAIGGDVVGPTGSMAPQKTQIFASDDGRLWNTAAFHVESMCTFSGVTPTCNNKSVLGSRGGSEWGSASISIMGESNSGTFWLSPNHYARASQGFDPTFNTLTDAVNFKAYYNYVYQMPLMRIAANPDMFQTGTTLLFLSCDSNDEWGIGDSTTKFFRELTAGGITMGGKSMAGGAIHDAWNSYPCAAGASPPSGSGCGSHTMSLRDYKIGLQYFSDIFSTRVASKSSRTGAVVWKSGNTCAFYIRADEISLAGEAGSLLVNGGSCRQAPEIAAYDQQAANGAGWDEAGFLERNPTISHLDDETKTKYQTLVDSKTMAEKNVIASFTTRIYTAPEMK